MPQNRPNAERNREREVRAEWELNRGLKHQNRFSGESDQREWPMVTFEVTFARYAPHLTTKSGKMLHARVTRDCDKWSLSLSLSQREWPAIVTIGHFRGHFGWKCTETKNEGKRSGFHSKWVMLHNRLALRRLSRFIPVNTSGYEILRSCILVHEINVSIHVFRYIRIHTCHWGLEGTNILEVLQSSPSN